MNVFIKRIGAIKKRCDEYLRNGKYESALFCYEELLSNIEKICLISPKKVSKMWERVYQSLKKDVERLRKYIEYTKYKKGGINSQGEKPGLYDYDTLDIKDITTKIIHSLDSGKLGVGFNEILDDVLNAQRVVRIITPWISKSIAKAICENSLRKRITLYILMKESYGFDRESTKNAFEYVKQMTTHFPNIIKARVLRNLHAKIVIIDDKFFYAGSLNLTTTALSKSIEFAIREIDAVKVKKMVAQFHKFWNEANPVV